MHPTKKAARIAGFIYLSMVFTAPFSLIYVPSKLIVRGNAAATADNILAHETMFRLAIFGDLVGQVIFICLAIALYRLLSNVNRTWALLMVGFVLVSAAVGFLNTLNNIAGLILFRGGEFLNVFDAMDGKKVLVDYTFYLGSEFPIVPILASLGIAVVLLVLSINRVNARDF